MKMKLSEKYEKLKKAAQADMRATRNRPTKFSGSYPKKATNLDGLALFEDVKTAAELGYETHLRIVDGALAIYYVANMPPRPFDVEYAG